MKLLGHAWIAVNSRPTGNRKLLIIGSILPEIMFYTSGHPFEFDEIHEGGDEVYRYLRDKKTGWEDLGLGMLTHSVKAGADIYNFDERPEFNLYSILGFEDDKVAELRTELSDILGITYDEAVRRTHNMVELAIELKILGKNPDFVNEFNEVIADKEVREEIKGVLTDCFHKPAETVSRSVDELFDKIKPEYFKNAEGLANLWAELRKGLDPVPDKQRLAELLQELSDGYDNRDEKFLRECINWTRSNLESILSHPERTF